MDHLSMTHIGGLLPHIGGLLPYFHSLQIPLHGSSLLWFLDGSSDGGDDYELICCGYPLALDSGFVTLAFCPGNVIPV
ncbi:Hypothetical predicted protein [Prunus dulcis]|uniref:Uncharacterized protein n=1 Tax=Prunus dulcis TaxID=3755 RepID=A0A5E4FCE6_PRUDU|nr:hypothetical protein L3X38_023959 [Prunus dulcis]VVA25596.1 Hypothetical predicted protein [Prunus dulcis]